MLFRSRRQALLERLQTALTHGFKEKGDAGPAERLAELAGHVNFGIQAVAGVGARAFARTTYQAVIGTPSRQPEPVYDALQWLEAIMTKPPSRIETTNHTANNVLLPDGYWSPETASGGMGGVLLLEGKQPQTWEIGRAHV